MSFKEKVDYTLYLVTDSTMLPEGTTLTSQVEEGLKNGVTLVQLREKDTDTMSFIEEALEVKKICEKYSVPLIINDRIDIALAIDADGVHVGQDDMPIPMVRKLVGPKKIIGWSVGKVEEVDKVAQWGPDFVDYIGVGTVFPTQTKKNIKKTPMGTSGVVKILDRMELKGCDWCKTVVIGGLHPDNIGRVIYQCQSSNGQRSPDGISVVSDIMAAADAAGATRTLREILDRGQYHFFNSNTNKVDKLDLMKRVKKVGPLIHHITNRVHQNFGANVALAIGCSPIMSEVAAEFSDLCSIPNSSLLLNTGSVAGIEVLVHAVKTYNFQKRPIVFDPVGFSASETRLLLNKNLLTSGQYSCIKGNTGEILGISGLGGKMKGVDSGEDGSLELRIKATQLVAFKYRTIAVCTGRIDIVADGTCSLRAPLCCGVKTTADEIPYALIGDIDIPLFGSITASGCSLGTVIAGFLGAAETDSCLFDVVKYAVEIYKKAGKDASDLANGSGSFQMHLIDQLYISMNDNGIQS